MRAPVSDLISLPAKAIDNIVPLAPLPSRYTAGYFIVTFEPRLPSTHSIVAFSNARARFVSKLYTLSDQF